MSKKRIGELLIEDGLIQQGELEEALERQAKLGGKIVEHLIALGALDVSSFVRFVARQPGIAGIDLRNYAISNDIVGLIPKDFALKHEVFPIDHMGSLLTVGMACPLDSQTIAELEQMTGLRVKALLCKLGDIQATIQRYYPEENAGEAEMPEITLDMVETGIRVKSIVSLVKKLKEMPSLPTTVQRVQEAMANGTSSMAEIAETIQRDPVVTAKIMRVVNSAAFALPNKISDITMAVTLLGLRETYMIVLAMTVPDLFEKSTTFDYKAFWKRSLFVGGACRSIAALMGIRKPGTFFTAGLLHDIGQAAIAEVAPKQYGKIDDALTGAARAAAEEEVFGLGYPEAGFLLAEAWGFPDELSQPIRFHLAPQHAEAAHKTLVDTVGLAVALCAAAELGEEALTAVMEQERTRLDSLGLNASQAAEIIESATAAAVL